MFRKIIYLLSDFIKNNLDDNLLNQLQEKLIQVDFYVKIEDLISFLILVTLFVFIISFLIIQIFNLNSIIVMISFIPSIFFVNYIIYKTEQKKDKLEEDLPDYLRQISSLLKVGLGIETAFNELSRTTESVLNNEIKRVLIEIRLGKSFNQALIDLTKRNDSENLRYIVQIIIQGRESGGNLAEILELIADDLNDMITLKKNRKTNVMMSVMFLLISSIVATPFALSMIRLYSNFIELMGRTNSLIDVIPLSSLGYIIIHSILVSILLGIVLYSNYKKGIKYIFIITPIALFVYYGSQLVFKGILGV
ncbi:MAG: type II secretion system protein F [Methanosphaera stadtmanae]|nr:type II secretion system protein F [Methanosphaera stadtmanae]